ncbi:polysaccharide biosynthesis tyrosine autokinase [candidate division KSB1 bacterium]|nr:polysaccharide biosynthesis tyrosine autokinase [candidate division KSB1 bacterium]
MNNSRRIEKPLWYDEESLVSTEFRRLFSKIRHLNKTDHEIRNLLVTSAVLGEGKSTTAAYLAAIISKYQNTNTLLIDCDLRRPAVHKLFNLDKDGGFIDVALKEKSLKSVLKSTFLPRLKVLTSGRLTQNPAEILNVPTIHKMFQEIKFYFDTIVIDCAPTIPVSDPLVLSSEVDGALMVVRAGKTPKETVKRATDLMRDAGMKILGIVLNNVEDVLPYYYNYQYDYREYATDSF